MSANSSGQWKKRCAAESACVWVSQRARFARVSVVSSRNNASSAARTSAGAGGRPGQNQRAHQRVRRRAPAIERRLVAGQPSPRRLFRANVVDRLVTARGEGEERPRHPAHRVLQAAGFEIEQRKVGRLPAHAQAAQIVGRRADETVADAKAMIEKAEGLAACERREPERQARELHRHGIGIDAKETALGDQPSNVRVLRFVEVGVRASTLVDERAGVRRREVPARRDEKRAAAHGGIDDAEREDRV